MNEGVKVLLSIILIVASIFVFIILAKLPPYCVACEFTLNGSGPYKIEVKDGHLYVASFSQHIVPTPFFAATFMIQRYHTEVRNGKLPLNATAMACNQVYVNKRLKFVDCDRDLPPPERLVKIYGHWRAFEGIMCVYTKNGSKACVTKLMESREKFTLYYDPHGRIFWDAPVAECKRLQIEASTNRHSCFKCEVNFMAGDIVIEVQMKTRTVFDPHAYIEVYIEDCQVKR